MTSATDFGRGLVVVAACQWLVSDILVMVICFLASASQAADAAANLINLYEHPWTLPLSTQYAAGNSL